MRRNFQTWLIVSIGLLLCLVIINGGVAYRNIRHLRDEAHRAAPLQGAQPPAASAAGQRAFETAVLGVVLFVLAGAAGLVALLVLVRRHLAALADAAQRMAKQRELWRATLASIGDGVIATDAAGRVTFLNAVAEKLTGWTQAAAAGEPLESVFHVFDEATRENADASASSSDRPAAPVLAARDGRQWPIESTVAPIAGPAGEVSGSVLVFREIGQRRRDEQALADYTTKLEAVNVRMNQLLHEVKAGEELFHTMADSIPQLAWMARADGHIYWYNRRWHEYTGRTLADMEGWGWQSVHDPRELPRVLAKWRAALARGESWEDTFPLRRHDGAMRWHLSRAEPLRDEQGRITCWFGTNTDITERLEMEEALREGDRRKDEFLAMLAHELRNPLAPISNALQIWPMVEHDRGEMDNLRAMMERQVRQLTRLIDDLLDVSRITRGKIELRRQAVDVGTIISAAIESVRPLVESCAHRLEVDLGDEPPLVDADVARLTQAFGNLLNNAVKYTPPGGHIRVHAAKDERQAVISIADNGIGIPPHMLSRIFEMFQQVDQSLNRSRDGLGLGLTLVKRLVELHGGTIEARSRGAGQGSEFIVRLPLKAADAPPRQPQPAAERANDLGSYRILVVDDVPASAKTLAMMLKSIGQQATVVLDGAAAVAYVETQRPDVVFLDIAMPGMNGYEVAQRLRASAAGHGVVLVALTGYGDDESRRKSAAAGFDRHLTKPVSMDQLTELLHLLPAARRARQVSAPLAD